jgi:predicted small secreted protein
LEKRPTTGLFHTSTQQGVFMKNTIKLIGLALIAAIALAGCPTEEAKDAGEKLDELLSGQPPNTKDTPYTVKLEITNESDFASI